MDAFFYLKRMSEKRSPYLSFVVTSRNDNHGGDLLRRLNIFVNGLITQARFFDLDSEIILIEWNPPGDRPRLLNALELPGDTGPCRLRIIEVPPREHRLLSHSDKMALFQMIAKNVGIRRARGEFVLATNIDLLYSQELMRQLASGTLQPGVMYRTDRWDVSSHVPDASSIEDQLAFCRDHVLRINSREGIFYPGHSNIPRWLRRQRVRLFEFRTNLRYLLPWRWGDKALIPFRQLHTNACGDFTLLSRGDWFSLRGYPELQIFSFNLDSLFLYNAYFAGIREEIFPESCSCYHIEHDAGWSKQQNQALMRRMKRLGIPVLDYAQFRGMVLSMMSQQSPLPFNGDDWGLADRDLPESVIT